MIGSELQLLAAEMGLVLPGESIPIFERFVDELKKWNRKINLTAIRNDTDIVIKHLVDSLMFATVVVDGETVLDIGSGGGFPAIPLSITRPDVTVVSVDAVGKKISFQRHVARLLALSRFEAVHARIEDLQESRARQFDVIVSRAFSSLDLFVTLAAPFMKSGGRMIAMKGPAARGEHEGVDGKFCDLGFEITSIQEYSLPHNRGERVLVTITAAKPHE